MRKKGLLLAILIACSAICTSIPNIDANAAGTKTVYVLTTYKGNDPSPYHPSVSKSYDTTKLKYNYDENGLLKTRTENGLAEEYTYDKSDLTKVNASYSTSAAYQYTNFIYDKKDRLQEKNNRYNSLTEKIIYYKSKLGGKEVEYSENGKKTIRGWIYNFNDCGQLTNANNFSVSETDGGEYHNGDVNLTFEYGSGGKLIKSTMVKSTEYYLTCQDCNTIDNKEATFDYVYSNGRVTQIKASNDYGEQWTRKLSYKRISVPSKYVKAVKEQQNRIFWNDIVLGVTDMGFYGETLNPIK